MEGQASRNGQMNVLDDYECSDVASAVVTTAAG